MKQVESRDPRKFKKMSLKVLKLILKVAALRGVLNVEQECLKFDKIFRPFF